MNEIAKMINEETRRLTGQTAAEFDELSIEEQAVPTPEEMTEFTDNIVSQIKECEAMKKKEQEEHLEMFGELPKGRAPFSYTISN